MQRQVLQLRFLVALVNGYFINCYFFRWESPLPTITPMQSLDNNKTDYIVTAMLIAAYNVRNALGRPLLLLCLRRTYFIISIMFIIPVASYYFFFGAMFYIF